MFRKKSNKGVSEATYHTGYLYNDYTTKDYTIPPCWVDFKKSFITQAENIISNTNPDCYNQGFARKHIQDEVQKAKAEIKKQQATNSAAIQNITKNRNSHLEKAKSEKELLETLKNSLLTEAKHLIALKEEKNNGNFSFKK